MHILAIETVGLTGSVAALDGERLLVERRLNPEQRSAQSLQPGIRDLLAEVGWRAADVELAAVASGPGSFTGLRIGVTTAKTLAYAVGCQAIGVHTLLAVAAQSPADVARVSVVLDAQRNELFLADFTRSADGRWTGEETTRIVVAAEWIDSLPADATVSGSGLAKIRERLPPTVRVLDPDAWGPRAGTIGRLGWQLYTAGRRDNFFDLVPHYFRRTAAEEQWERKHKP